MDVNGNHFVDCDDFRWGLIDYGVGVTKEEASKIIQYFDKTQSGQIDYTLFLTALRVSQLF